MESGHVNTKYFTDLPQNDTFTALYILTILKEFWNKCHKPSDNGILDRVCQSMSQMKFSRHVGGRQAHDKLCPTPPILRFEEALLNPPVVPRGLGVGRTVGIW